MDDIVLIILTLVVAVIGILNKQRKKNAAQQPAPQGNKQASGFWDLIMDNDDNQEDEVVDSLEPEVIVDDFEKARNRAQYSFVPSSEGSSMSNPEAKVIHKKSKKVVVVGEAFSLRKAVIYNEILNRKYL